MDAVEQAGESIYRAMEEENGMPRLGASATKLGIRKGKDILTDSTGMVHRPSFLPAQENGLSCAPTIASLPLFALPVQWGGFHLRTAVWKIDANGLGVDLIAQEDTPPGEPRHISIGPARSMRFDEFAKAIQATRARWQKVTKS